MTNLPAKIILVLSSFRAKFLEANGLKVTKTIKEFNFKDGTIQEVHLSEQAHPHHNNSNKVAVEGHSHHSKNTPQEIERQEFTKHISKQLHQIILENAKHYNELIIIGEPKALGELNHSLDSHVKSLVTKQISKDLVHHQISDIERAIFH